MGADERLTACVASALEPTSTFATERDAGSNCPYCRFTFKQGAALLRCPACSAAHHDDCWTDNGGCAVVGCSAAPHADSASAAPDRPPPTAVRPSVPPPPAGKPLPPPPAPAGRAASRLSANALAIGLIALAVVVGAVAASVALLGSSGDSGAPERAAPGASQAGTDDSGNADRAPSPRPVADDQREIVAVLRRYATAYTNHDTDSLRFVFTPDVTRHGLAPGGCRDASGRAAVLLQYRRQFDLGTGAYTLHGLVPSAITVDGTRASTDLDFSIVGGRDGTISFELERFAGVWRVSHVDSHC